MALPRKRRPRLGITPRNQCLALVAALPNPIRFQRQVSWKNLPKSPPAFLALGPATRLKDRIENKVAASPRAACLPTRHSRIFRWATRDPFLIVGPG